MVKQHPYKILDSVNYPSDLKNLNIEELKQLSEELREEIISTISKTGGHLGAGLGVAELTVALHYVFNTPKDLLVWDIGHQAYPHKVLTGRKDKLHTIRQPGGISGFLKRSESEYDVFGAGHSSTSISAALGLAIARDINGSDHDVIAVIGDGSISAGMAYEAMNNAGHLKKKMVVILNDNKMSIAPAVGAMSQYLCRLMSSKPYLSVRSLAKNFLNHMPSPIENFAKKAKKYAKDFTTGGNFFEEMGFHYVGPVDGHDLDQLVPILENIKEAEGISSPILLHVITKKGKGFGSPEECLEGFHAVSKFDLDTKIQIKSKSIRPTYTKVFAESLTKIAVHDESVVGITAAMPSGTGLNIFAERFPDRMFDVGIAEQHAVTFAAGLALDKVKPFVAIYSTFLQRAFDQVVHDVAIQSIPVRFAIDRAGLVGSDGSTHAGSFDIAYLAMLPNFVVIAPSDELELMRAVQTCYMINDRPSAFRFPRGEAACAEIPAEIEPFTIGKGRVVREGKRVAVLSLGTRLEEALKAAHEIEKQFNIKITVADARFAKPIDKQLILNLAEKHEVLITLEEGSIGGFGSHVMQFLSQEGLLDSNNLKFRAMFLPDRFIDHNNVDVMYEEAGLNASKLIKEITKLLDMKLKNVA
ncbi:1-deoxy-D-xylulose-5-phosphate synthase [Candidatus Jidaibacter acanthamoeba]|uniref:1-deoxy-D-xylulose-5-phosphate synthase n=1 Tax=Candidatus Jidaibacter acanthamoebae TaxID=86105 RepID=A0A0C1QHA9_9RICK|nr:1-deoxy-D-xylulose-5-phosphate synthase [Candidatus Jidaibacter acanthamoeba]KIE04939.1 1-deoxy-D-xylulose-5-phosphate synthase [Candidatus Jidaibacter acanthamoeba]